jgi:hypothetical protein
VLRATVTVQDTNSVDTASQVATIVAARPSVDENSTLNLNSDAARLTIKGTGFDATNTSANTHIFSQSITAAAVRGLPAVNRRSTMTSVVVTFTHLAPTNAGDLMSQVRVSGTWSTHKDNKSKVCEIVAVDPSLDENTTNLNSDARRLTVSGKGFDATNASANTFNFTQTTGDKVKGLIAQNRPFTLTRMTVSFTHLAPTNEGALQLQVAVNDIWRVSGSDQRTVAKIVAARPSVDENSTLNLNSDAARLTIKGTGFDATRSSNNTFQFLYADNVRALTSNTSLSSTMTRLILSFTHLAPTNNGSLGLQVTVSNSWSCQNNNTIIANIQSVKPTVNVSTENLLSDTQLITVNGKGFDAHNTFKNVITFQNSSRERALILNGNTLAIFVYALKNILLFHTNTHTNLNKNETHDTLYRYIKRRIDHDTSCIQFYTSWTHG